MNGLRKETVEPANRATHGWHCKLLHKLLTSASETKAIKFSPLVVLTSVCDQVASHCCLVYPRAPCLSSDLTVTGSRKPRTLSPRVDVLAVVRK